MTAARSTAPATLAWTQAQVQLRHLGIDAEEAADFQRLAGRCSTPTVARPSSDAIAHGAGSQSGLWPHGISGDLPIVLLRIDDVEDLDQVRQLLRAHEYWRMKRLAVDLVILNERAVILRPGPAGRDRDRGTQQPVPRSARTRNSRKARSSCCAPISISAEARALLQSVARVVAGRPPRAASPTSSRLKQRPVEPRSGRPGASGGPARRRCRSPGRPSSPRDLEFFNGLGGFDKDGREYVTVLDAGQSTPAPWINVVANPDFGFQVSADGSGYTWAGNSRENQLTPWSNDPVSDPPGEAIYVRDEDSGELWSADRAADPG